MNSLFLEASQYLEANGFRKKEGKLIEKAIFYLKDGNGVALFNDRMEFYKQDKSREFVKQMTIQLDAELDTFKWMLLLHATDTVPIKKFAKVVKEIAEKPGEEMSFVVDVFQSLSILQPSY